MSDASFLRALANAVDPQHQAWIDEVLTDAYVDELTNRYPEFRRTGVVGSSIVNREIARLEREVADLEARLGD